MVIVHCVEYGGCPLLGGSSSINAMLNSIPAMGFNRYIEVGRSSKGPLWEASLYYYVRENEKVESSSIIIYILLLLEKWG